MTRRPLSLHHWLLCAPLLVGMTPTHAHDYPTADRVTWVQSCMQDHPGHYFEMVNKCSCAIDRIASKVRYDDFVTMSTSANARSIGGERGGSLRSSDSIQKAARLFSQIQQDAKSACFISPGPATPAAPAASAP